MYVYYSLRNLAVAFGWLRREFFDWSNAIKSVWLIGAHLSGWLSSIADFFGEIEDRAYDLAGDWKAFYDWIIDNLGVSNVPSLLLAYADDLIAFIREPFEWIADIIRYYFPSLHEIIKDPVEWFLETLWRYTGLDPSFTDNPRAIIHNIVDNILGDVRNLLDDPYNWIVNILGQIIPDFWSFIYNPYDWVRDKIEALFPFVVDFLHDPDRYIEDRLIQFIDDIADRYRDRAIKIFEKIFNAIF